MTIAETDRSQRSYVSYIDRTREYYAALGYENPYQWAHFDEVPFARLPSPLAESRLALVTTASPLRERANGESVPAKTVWSGSTREPPERLYTDDLAWDKESTHTDDTESFLPIRRIREWVAAGRVGDLATRFHGVPTDYSQRRTQERDAPEILRRCREDGVDAALLVPL
jgi:D-proline reductase (dithiol) PrdB